jgi:hypothetical protein
MSIFKKMITLTVIAATTALCTHQLEAVAYVTDTGGYAYDESRAATNLAPAIALGTVAIVGIIAIAVQNSHDHSSSSSSSRGGHSGHFSTNKN